MSLIWLANLITQIAKYINSMLDFDWLFLVEVEKSMLIQCLIIVIPFKRLKNCYPPTEKSLIRATSGDASVMTLQLL